MSDLVSRITRSFQESHLSAIEWGAMEGGGREPGDIEDGREDGQQRGQQEVQFPVQLLSTTSTDGAFGQVGGQVAQGPAQGSLASLAVVNYEPPLNAKNAAEEVRREIERNNAFTMGLTENGILSCVEFHEVPCEESGPENPTAYDYYNFTATMAEQIEVRGRSYLLADPRLKNTLKYLSELHHTNIDPLMLTFKYSVYIAGCEEVLQCVIQRAQVTLSGNGNNSSTIASVKTMPVKAVLDNLNNGSSIGVMRFVTEFLRQLYDVYNFIHKMGYLACDVPLTTIEVDVISNTHKAIRFCVKLRDLPMCQKEVFVDFTKNPYASEMFMVQKQMMQRPKSRYGEHEEVKALTLVYPYLQTKYKMLKPALSKPDRLLIKTDDHVSRDFINKLTSLNEHLNLMNITLEETDKHIFFSTPREIVMMLCTVTENADAEFWSLLDRNKKDIFEEEWLTPLCGYLQSYIKESTAKAKAASEVSPRAASQAASEAKDNSLGVSPGVSPISPLAVVPVLRKSLSLVSASSRDSGWKKETFSEYTNYNVSTTKSLLKAIRILFHHQEDLPVELKKALGLTGVEQGFNRGLGMCEAFLNYFTVRFPGLVTTVFNLAVKKQVAGVHSFANFYKFKQTTIVSGTDIADQGTSKVPSPPKQTQRLAELMKQHDHK